MIRYWALSALLLIPVLIIPVSASQYGIVLSQTCLAMLKESIPTDCPTYEQLNAVFPDTTKPSVSGGFAVIDGIWQRGTSQMQNPWNYYRNLSLDALWIDPPTSTRDHIHLIIIEASIPEYKLTKNQQMPSYEIEFGKDRWINPNCTSATISAENWLFLTGDSLRYLQHKCDPEYTNFNHIVKHKFEKSYQDLATSSKYKLEQFVKESKEKYKVSYIGSNEIFDNKSVLEDEDEN